MFTLTQNALDTREEKDRLGFGSINYTLFLMQNPITEERVAKICADNNLSENDIWNLYVDARISLRQTHPGEQAIIAAIQQVGKRLKLEDAESAQLYMFLHQKMMG